MRKILFVAKMNETAKNLNAALVKYYQVQFCSPTADIVLGMLDVVDPDLVLISLIGVTDIDPVIFNRISTHYPNMPVLTIGTDSERKHFGSFRSFAERSRIKRVCFGHFCSICVPLSKRMRPMWIV